jgi:serine/threonine-protein kinase
VPPDGPEWELQPGEVFGPYRIDGQLGQGGVGVVYRATRDGVPDPLALKVLKRDLNTDSEYRQRFLHEARAATAVEHPHVVRVLDAGEIDGRPFLAMPLVTGRALDAILSRDGPLPVQQVLRLAGEIGSALDALHAAGLMHRDVKPANVLVDPGGSAALTDFGFAKGTEYQTLTAAGQVVGTLAYISPERLRGDRATPASDIYSLGCTVFESLVGEPPFTGADQMAVFMGHLEEEPPNPSWQRPELPPPFAAAVIDALAKDPAARPASGLAYAESLESMLRLHS